MRGHPGRRDLLPVGELARGDPGVGLDDAEQRDLPARDAERMGLATHEPREAEEHRPQIVGEGEGVVNRLNH